MSQLSLRLKVLWQRLVTIFHEVVKVADKGFVDLVGEAQASQFASNVSSILKTAAGKIVFEVIGTLSTSDIENNSAARAAAIDKILSVLKGEGYSAGKDTIELLVNLAIWTLKNKGLSQ